MTVSMKHSLRSLLAALSCSIPGALAGAQANVVPGIDVRLSAMRALEVFGRDGAFPDGVNGIAFETTVCNEGTLELPWFQPMNPRHPTIAFLVASVRDGRIVQLSNRSYLKHGFFAANANSCGPCQQPGGDPGEYLGVGCSDTYAVSNNGDNFYLGPPDEVDPWLGQWTRQCSLFDRGFPDVGAPENCDGRRSLTRTQAAALGPVNSRVQVSDQDLLAGGELFFQAHYVVEGLAEELRDDSLGSRAFDASWTGVRWSLVPSSPLLPGSVLQRWPGASVSSSTNGADDGRVFVAVVVSGPVEGFYRYEYALHNRDNVRAVAALSIPICHEARVRNAGFRDIDAEPSNDWLAAVRGDALVFTNRGEPLRWNTILNFWFESDAAPAENQVALTQFEPGSGEPAFSVPTRTPSILSNVYLGPGYALDVPPTLFAVGEPPAGELGNATFGLASAGNQPFEPNFLFVGSKAGGHTLQGCTLWIAQGYQRLASVVTSDADGVATHPIPIPLDVALEGKIFRAQAVGRVPGAGALFSDFELSQGLLVRLGNAIPGCP